MIREAGIDIVEVEFLNGWWATGAERAESDIQRAELFEAAKASVPGTSKSAPV